MCRRTERRAWRTPRRDRTRVLVEDADECLAASAGRVLQDAGYDVETCGGPNHLPGHRCPLSAGGRCELAAGADVIVHALNFGFVEHEQVLHALLDKHPDTPIVVEVPTPRLADHADLTETCTILRFPKTRSTLLDAIERAEAVRSTMGVNTGTQMP